MLALNTLLGRLSTYELPDRFFDVAYASDKGAFTEYLVRSIMGDVDVTPLHGCYVAGPYVWKSNRGPTRIFRFGVPTHQFDYVGRYAGLTFGVEVKSNKLHGYTKKIPRALSLLSSRFGVRTPLLIITPKRTQLVSGDLIPGQTHDRVIHVPLLYNRKEIERFAQNEKSMESIEDMITL